MDSEKMKYTKKDIENKITELPLWDIGNTVVFPTCREYVEIKEYADVELLNSARKFEGKVFVLPQTSGEVVTEKANAHGVTVEEKYSDIKIGTICEIKDVVRNDDDTYDAILQGMERALCLETLDNGDRRMALVAILDDELPLTRADIEKCKVYRKRIVQLLKEFSKKFFRVVGRTKSIAALNNIENYAEFCYKAAQFAELEPRANIKVLKCDDLVTRLETVTAIIHEEMQYLNLSDKILEDVQHTLSRQQKEMFLREQIRAIQRELGDDEASEADMMEDKVYELIHAMPEDTSDKILSIISKLRKLSPMSPDYQVMRAHAEFLLDLPWGKTTGGEVSLSKVKEILDRDHYAMEKVKERIVEYMAVKTMKNATARSIICLYGPPGTGKTSVVRSIAEALGRKYVRISLGGVHDEAEIRGHRKTYVGAMPGRILSAIKNAGTMDPVVLLDEIDKINGDYRGDPGAALLEVLDKEQNATFRDNYAEVPFDLSQVLFITTANSLDTIPAPLRDRLEIIELTSYTDEEKLQISKRHLVPKQIAEHGLRKSQVSVTDGAIMKLVNEYTMEAGVRSLERQIASLMRKTICILQEKNKKSYRINEERVYEMLGAGKAVHRFNTSADHLAVGTVNGLAWTSVGGTLLQVDVNVLEGTGKVEITGSIGDVMKESAKAALSIIRSRAEEFNIPSDFYKTKDIHVHIPEGATPKEGPSAGVTLTTAIISALTGIPVKQCVAMTGEVTIKGDVLAIGGLKEKSLAALKEGVSTIVVPEENRPEEAELPEEVKKGLKIVFARKIDDVFAVALAR